MKEEVLESESFGDEINMDDGKEVDPFSEMSGKPGDGEAMEFLYEDGEASEEKSEDGEGDEGPSVEDLDSEEELDREAAEAQADVADAKTKSQKRDRAQKRIKQLHEKSRLAAEVARRERDRADQLEAQFNEFQKTHFESTTKSLEAQENDIRSRMREAAENNDLAQIAELSERIADIKVQRLTLKNTPVPNTNSNERRNTVADEIWLSQNVGWERDPERSSRIRKAASKIQTDFSYLQPGTTEYYEKLDELSESDEPEEVKPKRTPNGTPPVNGRSSRSTNHVSSQRKGKVTLDKADLKLIRSMGLDPNNKKVREEMLREKMKQMGRMK